jgi:hypothetical protein
MQMPASSALLKNRVIRVLNEYPCVQPLEQLPRAIFLLKSSRLLSRLGKFTVQYLVDLPYSCR